MESLTAVRQLNAAGRFAEALKALEHAGADRRDRLAADLLNADLLERTGRFAQSRTLAESVSRSRDLTAADRSACELVLARLEWEHANTDSVIVHLQRSIALASQVGDLERLCWSQLKLLLVLSDRSGPDAVSPLFAELRANATKLGHAQVTAALHIFIGQMEARRGLLGNAQRHTRLGQQSLIAVPNLWLEATAENTHLGISLMLSDVDAAVTHGRRCLQLAEESGAVSARAGAVGNLGNVFFLLGRFDESVDYHQRAIALVPQGGETWRAAFESVARIRLAQDRADECALLLDEIEQSVRLPQDRARYVYRHTQLTRTQLLGRQGSFDDALAHADLVLSLAAEAGDHLLSNMAQLTKAELLQQANRIPESLTLLDGIADNLASQPPDLYAQYERILACALARAGHIDTARLHRERAERLYTSLRHAPGQIELARCWNAATHAATGPHPDRFAPAPASPSDDHPSRAARNVLEATAALLLHASRPELLAREIVDLFEKTGAVHHATAVARASDGQCELLALTGTPPEPQTPPDTGDRCMTIGFARDRTVEIIVRPKDDIESVAALNAVKLLLATLHDIESARAEREERMTLWPIEDVTTDAGHAVVTGRMRELMSFAKRIATTNVSVLITGESGTGKEILARAVHGYSARAQKPFIPFNCSAIPRDLLESQLFGYRRGAFTGADRDNPGIIRSARDGTLFLDEIGLLGLDLQPKLLRFLESGEICPLGDSTPFTVDVRVLAATNSNLERVVKEGLFREDLFYRLNVIRLQIPPLRERRDEIPSLVNHFVSSAAAEFRKHQIRIAEETMEHLMLCSWPGNIRQLQNEVRRMVALAEPNAVLTPAALSDEILSARPAPRATSNNFELAVPLNTKLMPTLSKIEREMIKVALHEHRGKADAAARALGISRKGLYLKRQRLGL